MRSNTLFALLLGAAACAPAFAQDAAPPPGPEGSAQEVARGYANPRMPNQEAINAAEAPATAALNNHIASASGAAVQLSAADRAQYEVDRHAYWDALIRHDARVDRRNERYLRQQNAYADAMLAWRLQVAECKKGHRKACNAPSPNPADFY